MKSKKKISLWNNASKKRGSVLFRSIKPKPPRIPRVKPLVKSRIRYSIPIPIKRKNMNWAQAKRRYPNLKPFGDIDKDGIINIKDCRPLNRKKKGWAHEGGHLYYPDRVARVKMMSPKKFLRTTYIETQNRTKRMLQDPERNPKSVQLKTYEEYSKGVINLENVEKLKKAIKSKKEKMDIPYLVYDKEGRPKSHEGRHRAKAAEELGVKLIPVTIIKEKPQKEGKEITTMKELERYEKDKIKRMEQEDKEEIEHKKYQKVSASADIPIKEQREYGKEKPEALKSLETKEDILEEDILEVETKDSNVDYDYDKMDDDDIKSEENGK